MTTGEKKCSHLPEVDRGAYIVRTKRAGLGWWFRVDGPGPLGVPTESATCLTYAYEGNWVESYWKWAITRNRAWERGARMVERDRARRTRDLEEETRTL